MSIKVMESSMVYPATDTPSESLWLSRIDMIRQPYTHLRVFYIYHHPTNKINDDNSSNFFNTQLMKEALSRVLVPFYPVAGRLKLNDRNGRYEVECNSKGVLFIEAEATDQALDDFGDYSSPECELRKMVFPTIDYSRGLSSFPLMVVQLTRFKCGGVCLGLSNHHHVGDGLSFLHLTNSWARLAKGLDLRVHPVHDRSTYLGPRHPPRVEFPHKVVYEHPSLSPKKDSSKDSTMSTRECLFALTKGQVDALKLQASNLEMPNNKVSTFAVLAGHIWRSVCKARQLEEDQEVRLYIPFDGRSRLKDPTLPQGYFGNVIFYEVCIEKVREVICKPMWYVASKIQHAIKRMDDVEYLRSAIDYLESNPDVNMRRPEFISSPNLCVTSWVRLPFKEGDFGWGEPEFTNVGEIEFEGQTYLKSDDINGDGSFLVVLKLYTPHVESFEKYFYDF